MLQPHFRRKSLKNFKSKITQTLNSSWSTSVKQMPSSLEVMGSKSAVYWALFILLSSKSFMQRYCTTDFPWNKWIWFIFLRGILFFPLQYFADFCFKKRFKIFINLSVVTKTRTSKTDHASLPLEKPQKVLRTHFLKTSVSFHFSFLNSRLKLILRPCCSMNIFLVLACH